MKIPEQYLPIMPYLMVNKAASFRDFMKAVFDAREQMVVPAEDGIMHGELRIGDAVVMFADAGGRWKEKPAALYLYVTDVRNTYNRALGHGCKSLESPSTKDYGFTAGFEDPFGNQWFIVEGEA